VKIIHFNQPQPYQDQTDENDTDFILILHLCSQEPTPDRAVGTSQGLGLEVCGESRKMERVGKND
jgi:hypothetical protein